VAMFAEVPFLLAQLIQRLLQRYSGIGSACERSRGQMGYEPQWIENLRSALMAFIARKFRTGDETRSRAVSATSPASWQDGVMAR
jgi:hypothetical protein